MNRLKEQNYYPLLFADEVNRLEKKLEFAKKDVQDKKMSQIRNRIRELGTITQSLQKVLENIVKNTTIIQTLPI
jgi:hypothetical protein